VARFFPVSDTIWAGARIFLASDGARTKVRNDDKVGAGTRSSPVRSLMQAKFDNLVGYNFKRELLEHKLLVSPVLLEEPLSRKQIRFGHIP
jgi:hypothetical protein